MRQKLVVVNGDLSQPGLGLSAVDRRRLMREVNFVVHSAASISFVEPVHTLLAQNYQVPLRFSESRECGACCG